MGDSIAMGADQVESYGGTLSPLPNSIRKAYNGLPELSSKTSMLGVPA